MTKTSNNPLETFEDEVFEAQEKPDEDWRQAIDETRARLEQRWPTSPSAELAFAIGYCWFHMPEHEPKDFERAKQWLLRAMKLDSGHRFAAYYLGCLFFEYQLWDESEEWLKSIPANWFESRELAWRERKREEMLICIKLMTNAAQVSVADIQEVMAIHYDDPSVEVWPLPSELVETVARLRQIDFVSFRRLGPVLARELAATELADIYRKKIGEFESDTRPGAAKVNETSETNELLERLLACDNASGVAELLSELPRDWREARTGEYVVSVQGSEPWLEYEFLVWSLGEALRQALSKRRAWQKNAEIWNASERIAKDATLGRGRQPYFALLGRYAPERASEAIIPALDDPELAGHAVEAARIAAIPGLEPKVREVLKTTDKGWVRREAKKYLAKFS